MSGSSVQELQAVLCDMCLEEDRKPARKTCTKCEISMCVQHLQAHLTTPVLLQTHPLTEPGAAAASVKCPLHGKLLEYYCLDDLTCVCVSCSIEDHHRLHNMKTFSTADKELREQVRADQQALRVKTGGSDLSPLETWEKNEREKVCRSSVRLIEAVTELRDMSLATVQSSVSARMVSLKSSASSVDAALRETDAFGFLQMYSQVRRDLQTAEAVDLRPGLEPGGQRDKLVEELQQGGEKMVQQAGQFLCALVTLVDPENQHNLGGPHSDLTFDTSTLGCGMSLSEDNRKVFYSRWKGELDAHLLRIQRSRPDGKQGGKTNQNFEKWAIALPKSCDWTVGLCDTNYAEKIKDGEVYALRCQDQALVSLCTTQTTGCRVFTAPVENVAQKWTRPQKVEVVHDVKNRSLSFFSMTGEYRRVKLVTVQISSPVHVALCPFVYLEKAASQKNTGSPGFSFGAAPSAQYQQGESIFGVPLFGSSPPPQQVLFGNVRQASQNAGLFGAPAFSHQQGGFGFGTTPQNLQPSQTVWKCHCGDVYTKYSTGYRKTECFNTKSSPSACSCGAVPGSPLVTEVLCELL